MNANVAATPASTSAEQTSRRALTHLLLLALLALLALSLAATTAWAADHAVPHKALGVTFARRLPQALRLAETGPDLPELPPPLPLRRGHVPEHPAVPARWATIRLPVPAGVLDRLNVTYFAELNRHDEPVRVRAVVQPSTAGIEAPTTRQQRAWGTPEACEALQQLVAREMRPRHPTWQHPDAAWGIPDDTPLRGTLLGSDGLLIELVCFGGTLLIDYFDVLGYRDHQRDYEAQVRQWRDGFAASFADLDGELVGLFGIAFTDPIPDLRYRAMSAHAHVYDVYLDFDPVRPLPQLAWMAIRDANYRMRIGPDGRLVDVRAELELVDETAARALFDEFTAMFRVVIGAPSKRSERQWIFRNADRFLTIRIRGDDRLSLSATDAGALHELIDRRERRERVAEQDRQKRNAARTGDL